MVPIEIKETYNTEPIEEAEKILHDYTSRENIELIMGGNKAFYSPDNDSITLPCIRQFKQAEEFYSTAFHECGHSTLKKCRCDREEENTGAYFGSMGYSKEELVAEITSAAVLHSIEIETPDTFRNSVAYIKGWLEVLKNDKKFIVSASCKAEKAAKYILNIKE